MVAPKQTSILIAHPQPVMANLSRFLLESEFSCNVSTTQNLKEARQIFERGDFQAVLCASSFPEENGFNFFKELVDQGKYPAFLFLNNSESVPPNVYKNVMVKAFINEKNLFEDLKKVFEELLSIELTSEPEEWTKVSLLPLVHFKGLPEDVYIQLKTGRMLKLFSKGDHVTSEDVKRYSDKGVTNLYLEHAAYLWLIKELNNILPSIVEEPEKDIEFAEPFTPDEEVEEELSETVTDAECPPMDSPLPMERVILEELHDTSKKVLTQMKKNKDIAKLLKQGNPDRDPHNFYKTRASLVCNISCAVARELSWSSDAMFEKLIYVAYTHDLTLVNHPHLARLETTGQLELTPGLTAEENNLFLNHPNRVADIVGRDPKAPAEAEAIIRQHHERASGKGFPEALQSARIMPTAALMQISIDFAQYILENPKWSFDAYAAKAAGKFRGGPFTKIFKALETLCKGKL